MYSCILDVRGDHDTHPPIYPNINPSKKPNVVPPSIGIELIEWMIPCPVIKSERIFL